MVSQDSGRMGKIRKTIWGYHIYLLITVLFTTTSSWPKGKYLLPALARPTATSPDPVLGSVSSIESQTIRTRKNYLLEPHHFTDGGKSSQTWENLTYDCITKLVMLCQALNPQFLTFT